MFSRSLIFLSRLIVSRSVLACPQVVDIVNHDGEANCQFDEDTEGQMCDNSNGPAVLIRTTRDIRTGDELLVNYGPDAGGAPKSPVILLVGYGIWPSSGS